MTDSLPFIKFMRSEATDELLRHPNSFTLLALIAQRARRELPTFNPYGLQVGEAMIGDYEAAGLSRQEFRTALANLQKRGLITSRSTNKGTIVRLSNTSVYDINAFDAQPATQPEINQQPNQKSTTNKNVRSKEENNAADAATLSSLENSESAFPSPTSSAKAVGKRAKKSGATTDEAAGLATPHLGDRFTELWTIFRTSSQHARKSISAFQMMLTKLGKYPEEFAVVMLESAIQGGWSGVENPGTDRAFKQWQAEQASRPPAPGVAAAPTAFNPASLFGLDEQLTPEQVLARQQSGPEYQAYLAREAARATQGGATLPTP